MDYFALVDGKQVIAVVCMQWGDSGKGKVVDILMDWADINARGTGGNNAGHTVKCVLGDFIFHLVPSGILYDKEGKFNVMGQGMNISLQGLVDELSVLDRAGLPYNNLLISDRANVVLPQQVYRDLGTFAKMTRGDIGSTGRGMGTCYSDEALRTGIKLQDLFDKDRFVRKLKANMKFYPEYQMSIDELVDSLKKNSSLILTNDEIDSQAKDFKEMLMDYLPDNLKNSKRIDVDEIVETQLALFQKIKPFVTDTYYFMNESLRKGRKILLEGAQGTLLSKFFGTWPDVTSSDCTVDGLAQGVGLNAKFVDATYGIVKAPYMTRVGNGPFPTEFGGMESELYCSKTKEHDRDFEKAKYDLARLKAGNPMEFGIYIRIIGDEYGATTARPRRTGRLDLVALRFASYINSNFKNGKADIIITKPDVFNDVPEIELCTGYNIDGNFEYRFLSDSEKLRRVVPFYIRREGWMSDLGKVERWSDQPLRWMDMMEDIERYGNVRIAAVSTGPKRDQFLVR